MVKAYELLIEAPKSKVDGQIFNTGYENKKILELAEIVKKIIGDDVKLTTTISDDNRSYHISSEKIKKILGFESKYTISDAVTDLKTAFAKGLLANSLQDEKYFNIKRMRSIKLI
jgi:nucleoside-diphosphate-sugar epimerase